jgi:hypothetical protein
MEIVIKQRNTGACLQGEGIDVSRESIHVNITLYRVPGDLVREFARRVVVNYPGGMSEAIQDLMRRALKE